MLDAVQSVESLDDGRIRVHVDAGGHHATYVVAIARTTAPSPTPLTCKGDDGLTYPAFHLVAMAGELSGGQAKPATGRGV